MPGYQHHSEYQKATIHHNRRLTGHAGSGEEGRDGGDQKRQSSEDAHVKEEEKGRTSLGTTSALQHASSFGQHGRSSRSAWPAALAKPQD
jgi:hypothetical protein